MATVPKEYSAEARDCAVRMVLDRLSECPSIYAACKALAPKIDVGPESFRRQLLQAPVDTGEKDGRRPPNLMRSSSCEPKIGF